MTLLSITGEEKDSVAAPCFTGTWNGIWAKGEKWEVSNEHRNVPGNDGSMEETSPQGFIHLGDMTRFLLVIVLEPQGAVKPPQRTTNWVWALWSSGQDCALCPAIEWEHFKVNVHPGRMPPTEWLGQDNQFPKRAFLVSPAQKSQPTLHRCWLCFQRFFFLRPHIHPPINNTGLCGQLQSNIPPTFLSLALHMHISTCCFKHLQWNISKTQHTIFSAYTLPVSVADPPTIPVIKPTTLEITLDSFHP